MSVLIKGGIGSYSTRRVPSISPAFPPSPGLSAWRDSGMVPAGIPPQNAVGPTMGPSHPAGLILLSHVLGKTQGKPWRYRTPGRAGEGTLPAAQTQRVKYFLPKCRKIFKIRLIEFLPTPDLHWRPLEGFSKEPRGRRALI